MIHYTEILRASLETLNAELAADGRPTQDNIDDARREAIVMVYEANGPFDLMSMDGSILRAATPNEAIESCLAGDEGVIEVDGVSCYVLP